MYTNERHPNLVLKLNVPFALKDGEKIALEYAPARKADGTVLVPAFIEGFGGKAEDFEGKKYFALESISREKNTLRSKASIPTRSLTRWDASFLTRKSPLKKSTARKILI